jgi:[CysO sulfur-carrier protein]-S-L-cysteine hydrolase
VNGAPASVGRSDIAHTPADAAGVRRPPSQHPDEHRAGREAGDGPPTVGSVLTIDEATRDAIVAHARRDHPDEACGVVAGPAGSGRPERFVPMLNAARSPTFYEFDSLDLLNLYKQMDDRDEEPVVIYHSHTATEAYPSRTDIGLAQEPDSHYVLVSTRECGNDEGPVEFRSFRIVENEVTEEAVRVVASYDEADEHPSADSAPVATEISDTAE